MVIGVFWFMVSGWIECLYGELDFFFKFYGFEWVELFSVVGMYWVYGIVGLSVLGIMLGLFYCWLVLVFWLSFIYMELIDVINYFNYYYLVVLLGLLLIFLLAYCCFFFDVWCKLVLRVEIVLVWCIYLIML